MATLYVESKVYSQRVTVVRLEQISANYSSAMGRVFDALLRPLRLPAHGTNTSVAALQRALVEAAKKFDLSRNAPMPDKLSHVSNKDDKQDLRNALMRDSRLRPLLRGLRQALDYESLPAWQPPPDLQRLSTAIDDAVSLFWKTMEQGDLASKLFASVSRINATERHAYAHAPRVLPARRLRKLAL